MFHPLHHILQPPPKFQVFLHSCKGILKLSVIQYFSVEKESGTGKLIVTSPVFKISASVSIMRTYHILL